MREIADEALVERSRAGDPRALAELYRRFAPALLDYLTRIAGSRAEAEDLLHETFLRLFEGRGRYEATGRFRAWLFTVATRLAFDRRRDARRRDELSPVAGFASGPASPPDPLREAEARELAARVDSALADLPASYAQAFFLRVREEWTYREIAEACGEPEGTLRSRVHHALKQIRRALGPVTPAPNDTTREKQR